MKIKHHLIFSHFWLLVGRDRVPRHALLTPAFLPGSPWKGSPEREEARELLGRL